MRATTKETQAARILRLLKQHGYMTNYELNDRVGFRYGARIHEQGSEWRFYFKYAEGERVPLTARLRLRSAKRGVAV